MMKDLFKVLAVACLCFAGLFTAPVWANQVTIVGVVLEQDGADTWQLDVTLHHQDQGWDHYADRWRVVDTSGQVLAERVLQHPHVNEQAVTRSLSQVPQPEQGSLIYIEAHDTRHGWSEQRIELDLSQAIQGRLRFDMPR